MKKVSLFLLILYSLSGFAQKDKNTNPYYLSNRAPLYNNPYIPLPLGAIKPKGLLFTMLDLQRKNLSSNVDSVYEFICGPRNAWLGGDGDCWERGPYWIDGLVPLAYILDDDRLKAKAQKWIDYTLNNQREDGYIGPRPYTKEPTPEPGMQKYMPEDWWPRMVMLKILMQYYDATKDKRVIDVLTKYFRYQLQQLPNNPLGKWTFWASQRGGDNLLVVLWLYNITGDKFLLDLAEIIHSQTTPWLTYYTDGILAKRNPYADLHCVNVAQGLKEPIVYYQLHPEQKYKSAVRKGIADLMNTHGFVNGMYGGDEMLHGNNPTQGSELCSAVEMMYSFESILPITADVYYADYLEKIAYNVLPAQHDDNFTRRQYFQQPNQVLVTDQLRNFMEDGKARICFGVITGYPCCTVNMHQGWPKFVQNLWYATFDKGIAALVFGPSEVNAKVADGVEIRINEETMYPFSDRVKFTIQTPKSAKFPFHVRIPEWCINATIKINGITTTYKGSQIVKIDRVWTNNDVVELELPMSIRVSRWYENSVGIERGPLVYGLRIEEDWREVKSSQFKDSFYEVYPKTPWNYGLLQKSLDSMNFKVEVSDNIADMPWNLANAPITIKTKGRRIESWQLYNNSAGPLPSSVWPPRKEFLPLEEITLVPYGCSALRISEFPVTQ